MTSPLILLVASAVIVGGVATLVVIVAISVDSWQSIRFDNSIISRINNSDNGVTILSVSSATQLYRVTVTGPPDSTTGNSSVARYIVHSSKNGLWRTCDDLSGTQFEYSFYFPLSFFLSAFAAHFLSVAFCAVGYR